MPRRSSCSALCDEEPWQGMTLAIWCRSVLVILPLSSSQICNISGETSYWCKISNRAMLFNPSPNLIIRPILSCITARLYTFSRALLAPSLVSTASAKFWIFSCDSRLSQVCILCGSGSSDGFPPSNSHLRRIERHSPSPPSMFSDRGVQTSPTERAYGMRTTVGSNSIGQLCCW